MELSECPLPEFTKLTVWQKMSAMSLRFYSRVNWTPVKGDYYTSSRADTELYQIVDIRDGTVYTRYIDPVGTSVSEWDEKIFLSADTFGYARVFVPRYIISQPHPRDTP